MPHLLFEDGPGPYDSVSSSSSSPSSPPPLRHRLRRTRSPSPSSRYMPHYYFPPSSRPYSPSSREADIARILDPAYASPAPHSPLTQSPRMARKEVYVDHRGDLHDPDFRDFPPFGHSHMLSRRPLWERGYDDDDDEVNEELDQLRPTFDLQPRRPSSSLTYHPPPVYYPYEEHASYESGCLAEDDDDEGEQLVHAPLKEKSFYCRPRSPTKRSKDQDEKQSPSTTEGDHILQADSEWTPTCTQNLRRHWQAITLSLRFSLFRTKRRLKRRLTG
ncbi:hypothetical protein J3R83DRAFT_4631 [Lanmaoa asiatica]|nr:hypothetical protein J3R83DRAFT_4631 [Lanmaoa asiatica]